MGTRTCVTFSSLLEAVKSYVPRVLSHECTPNELPEEHRNALVSLYNRVTGWGVKHSRKFHDESALHEYMQSGMILKVLVVLFILAALYLPL